MLKLLSIVLTMSAVIDGDTKQQALTNTDFGPSRSTATRMHLPVRPQSCSEMRMPIAISSLGPNYTWLLRLPQS